MYHNLKDAAIINTDRYPTIFGFTMLIIVNRKLVRIAKDCRCFTKRHLMLIYVPMFFRRIPIESVTHLSPQWVEL